MYSELEARTAAMMTRSFNFMAASVNLAIFCGVIAAGATTRSTWGGEAAVAAASDTAAVVEPKTAAEWLDAVAAEDTSCRARETANPQAAQLLRGAALSMLHIPIEHISDWPAADREARNAYLAWWTATGAAAFKTWQQAGFPDVDDDSHLMFHAVAMEEYQDIKDKKPIEDPALIAYGERIIRRGISIQLRGCSGEKLSPQDLRELRLFAMYSSHICFGEDIPIPIFRGWTGHNKPIAGTPAPDLSLPLMEDILARPTYSDHNPFDQQVLFRPGILKRILQIMDGYEATSAEEQKVGHLVRPKQQYHSGFTDPVVLSARWSKRPILVMLEDATDTWTWSGLVFPAMEPLKQSLADKVDFFFIHSTVHDQFMPGAPASNGWVPGQLALHCVSPEERARTAKMCYMTYPLLSIPYLLDDPAEHALDAFFCDAGETASFLIDTKGTVAFSLWQDPGGTYMWRDTGTDTGYCAIPSRNQRVLNLLECNIKALLDAHGVWNSAVKPVVPDWTLSRGSERVRLTSVDAEAGTITITGKDLPPTVIAVDAQTRIVQANARKAFGDLVSGAEVSLYDQDDKSAPAGRRARLIVIGGSLAEWWFTPGRWLPAVVESVDPKTHTLRATISFPLKDCKGPALWDKASPDLLRLFNGRIETERNVFQKFSAMVGSTVTLHVDRATDLFLNGMTAQIGDVKAGDKLSIEWLDGFTPEDLWPHVLRVHRY